MVDEENVRNVVSRTAESARMRVLTAQNGPEALEVLAVQKPDLIILDLLMPEMDGFEFLAKYNSGAFSDRAANLMYSAMELDETLRASLQEACVAVIDKNTEDSLGGLEQAISTTLALRP